MLFGRESFAERHDLDPRELNDLKAKWRDGERDGPSLLSRWWCVSLNTCARANTLHRLCVTDLDHPKRSPLSVSPVKDCTVTARMAGVGAYLITLIVQCPRIAATITLHA